MRLIWDVVLWEIFDVYLLLLVNIYVEGVKAQVESLKCISKNIPELRGVGKIFLKNYSSLNEEFNCTRNVFVRRIHQNRSITYKTILQELGGNGAFNNCDYITMNEKIPKISILHTNLNLSHTDLHGNRKISYLVRKMNNACRICLESFSFSVNR